MMRLTATALASLVLGGCASFSQDGGFTAVEQLTKERVGQTPTFQRTGEQADSAKARVAELLKQPLTADSVVEVALLNNRDLQASYAELGIAESDLVRAGRLANPSFSFGRLSGGGAVEIERAVLFDVLSLFTMPLARQVEQRRFEQTQLQAAYETVGIAGEARKAFFEAVTAQQLVGYFGQVKEAADASNELAKRMAAAGNFNKLSQMCEQSFYSDAMAQLARVQHQAVASRERLTKVLALSGDQLEFKLPERLPDLPSAPAEPNDAEQTAMDKRLDVLMAKRATESTAKSLGLTKTTRFVNVLHAGYQNKSETGESRSNGYEIELELPLFDFGSARVARAEATYMQSMNRTAQVAINARSEVRESYSAYRTAYDLAMDGVTGLTQPPIAVGKTFLYEFVLQRPGTFMYHPHADEMVQMAMGMMGLFIVHPKDPKQFKVDRDFGFILNAYDIEPGSATPKVNTMLDFNLWTWNSRAFPGIDPFVARTGERVRIRVGNLTMTNHPIHMHGPHFEVTGTQASSQVRGIPSLASPKLVGVCLQAKSKRAGSAYSEIAAAFRLLST